MIAFHYETDFSLSEEAHYRQWIINCLKAYAHKAGEVNYIFCDDAYLLPLNKTYLKHDTLTDVISFDYTEGREVSGDVYISLERVRENAWSLCLPFEEELRRVMIHGILHYLGFKDKSDKEKTLMRMEEDKCLRRFNER